MCIQRGKGKENVVFAGINAVKETLFMRENIAVAAIASLAILHITVITLLARPLLTSNVVQLLAPILAMALCVRRAREADNRGLRKLWYQLSISFLIWAVTQADYLWHLIEHKSPPNYPRLIDFLWLLSSFPILLAAAKAQDRTENDWTRLLDVVQACLSVCLLYAVIFVIPVRNSDSLVFGIQSAALLFACVSRCFAATSTTERIFFRDLTFYVISYGILFAAGLLAQDYGAPSGGVIDLAWSFPALIFCLIAIRHPAKIRRVWEKPHHRNIMPSYVHGISSLGLALTSLTAGVVLILFHPSWGIFALATSCILLVIRTVIRESQLKRVHLQLEYDNLHDGLTGLANRTLLIHELEKPSSPPSSKRSILFLDLDRFKIINDSLGHGFGDRLLIHVANVLRSSVRSGDTVARLSGDEFVILLNEGKDGLTAETVAERILHTLRSPISLDGRLINLTGSIGIVAVPEDKVTAQLLRDADTAMYMAKSQGKNRMHIFDQSARESTNRELKMETDLRHTMEEGSILVSYQPIYSLTTEALEGFEALTRWNHPQLGMILPGDFIPLAEDTGLIIDLGKQVLQKACCQVATWNRQFRSKLALSVNLSAQQLIDKGFLPYVKQVLRETQLEASLLKFEITESVLLEDRELAEEVLSAAQAMGIEICLDNFGTGYSSLNTLLEFPLDTIKVDSSFLRDIDRDQRRAEIMHTIVQLAKNLTKKVIIEGIETTAQLEFIAGLPSDSVQGYLLARPLLPEAMTGILEGELRKSSIPRMKTLGRLSLSSIGRRRPEKDRDFCQLKGISTKPSFS
jgi:diguanylate cyclase (GGDEF)-like protein